MPRLNPQPLRLAAALAALLGLAAPAPLQAQEALEAVAKLGPWPVASKPVAYGGRIWFVNSVKGRNHNSADLYSYDPETGRLRYERRLFSQDAGDPLVARGLLHWPFEDARSSLGWGHAMVTDGKAWQLLTVTGAQIFHTHALAEAEGRLVAATSAWRAGLQVSADEGGSWKAAYDHPTPPQRVSRIVSLANVRDRAAGFLTSKEERLVVSLHGDAVSQVTGLPRDPEVVASASDGSWLYLLLDEAEGDSLWRSDGVGSERIVGPRADWNGKALAVGEDGTLWLATDTDQGGLLWRTDESKVWQIHAPLKQGEPNGIALLDGRPYVTGAGDDGLALLWGPPAGRKAPAGFVGKLSRDPRAGTPGPLDWALEARELAALLAAPASYREGRALRDRVFRLARARPPAGFFTELLVAPMPDLELSAIGGAVKVSATDMGRWILLWGMAVAGVGPVPKALLAAPWSAPANPSEKYFEPVPGAIWAAGMIGQKDRATVAALVERLGRDGDPKWLEGDAVGALTAITGQRFGYDAEAWRGWWQKAAETWPDS